MRNLVFNFKSNAHIRWTYLGILTQREFFSDFHNTSIFITENPQDNTENSDKRLIIFDAMSLLGWRFEYYDKIFKANIFSTIYVVGDIITKVDEFISYHNVKLLFRQDITQTNEPIKMWQQISILSKIKYRILPCVFYALRDILNYPFEIIKLLRQKRTILFAGQTGIYSIINLFHCHTDKNNSEECNRITDFIEERLCKNNYSFVDTENLARTILFEFEILKEELEKLKYSIIQPNFKYCREVILFKSIFRYFVILFLQKKGYLTVISYPKMYIRIYNSKLLKKHLLIDFGGVNGYENIYPRMADIIYNKLDYFQLDQLMMEQCQVAMNLKVITKYLECELANLLNKLNYYNEDRRFTTSSY
jgi:hypothetical protein